MLIPLLPPLMPALTTRCDVISLAYVEQKVLGTTRVCWSDKSSARRCGANGGPCVNKCGCPPFEWQDDNNNDNNNDNFLCVCLEERAKAKKEKRPFLPWPWKKGPRFYWNIIYDKFAGLKGQRHQFCKHTLCLAPLFVREGVVNRVGDVVCVCGRARACAGALLVMCLHLLWPCYLVCRIN